jgi:hypothetical protein
MQGRTRLPQALKNLRQLMNYTGGLSTVPRVSLLTANTRNKALLQVDRD